MLAALVILAIALISAVAYALWQSNRRAALERERVIRGYVFPPGVLEQFRSSHPSMDLKGTQLVARALRQFFLVHGRAGAQMISMPSKAADALWHSFILDTKAYSLFCRNAFGVYLHHIPTQVDSTREELDSASLVTWRLACLEENINPSRATRLPLLYAIDNKVGFPGAVAYDPRSFKQPSSPGGCSGGGSGGSCDGDGGGGCGGD
jgi:hypothetical protein